MDEAGPLLWLEGLCRKDDRRLQHKCCAEKVGVRQKEVSVLQKNDTLPWAKGRREISLRSIQGLKRSVGFMRKAWNRMAAMTLPVCLNAQLQL